METRNIALLKKTRQWPEYCPATVNAYLSRADRDGTLVRVRRGTYALPGIYDRFAVAAMAVKDGVLAYHSAMEFHARQTQVFNHIQVASRSRFNDFSFQNERYVRVPLKYRVDIQTVNIDGTKVRSTSLSQTTIDCIARPDLCAGHEEIANFLESLLPEELNYDVILRLLKKYDNKSLWQRTGYMMQLFAEETGAPGWFLDVCHREAAKTFSKFPSYGTLTYNREWNMMVPEELQKKSKKGIADGIYQY